MCKTFAIKANQIKHLSVIYFVAADPLILHTLIYECIVLYTLMV